jgi:hypothetical protein
VGRRRGPPLSTSENTHANRGRLALVALIGNAQAQEKDKPKDAPTAPVALSDKVDFKVKAEDFSKECLDDEKKAEAKYKGKVVELTGLVALVQVGEAKDETQPTRIVFYGDDKKTVEKLVFCDFGVGGQKAAVRGVDEDKAATIRGRFKGVVFGTPTLSGSVVVPPK